MLTRMEQCPTLAYDDITGNHVLVYCVAEGLRNEICESKGEKHRPENFLTPRRFPGEPP